MKKNDEQLLISPEAQLSLDINKILISMMVWSEKCGLDFFYRPLTGVVEMEKLMLKININCYILYFKCIYLIGITRLDEINMIA